MGESILLLISSKLAGSPFDLAVRIITIVTAMLGIGSSSRPALSQPQFIELYGTEQKM